MSSNVVPPTKYSEAELTRLGILALRALDLPEQDARDVTRVLVLAGQVALARPALAAAGIFALVLEGIPAELAGRITASVPVPTIGIGAGVNCDGQVQVVNDLLGLFAAFVPKHARQYANLTAEIEKAFMAYAADVRGGSFPGPENSF